MKIFITGGTGFIGQHLVRRLMDEGHTVRCLARKSSDRSGLAGLPLEWITGDVTDRTALCQGMAGCDWVFHLANLYSMWEPTPDAYWRVNVDGTRLVLECAHEARVQRVVYVSTAAVYGKPSVEPFDEETSPGRTLFSEYARSKAAAERIAWSFRRKRGLPLTVIHPGIVLGAGDDKASGQYIQGILRRRVPSTIFHGSASTYVAVQDVVEAVLRAAALPEAEGQKFLVGNEVLTGREFVRLIHEESGVRLPLLRLPDWLVIAAARLLTAAAKVTRRPPPWGLSLDAARTLKHGFRFRGERAARVLGITYTPIRQAVAGAVASYVQDERGSARRWGKPAKG